jgi:hypothetical protein
MSIHTYQQMIAYSTKDLPSGIDYIKYIGKSNNSGLYSSLDLVNCRRICITIAKNLTVKSKL